MSSLLAIDAGQSGIKVRHLAEGPVREWAQPGIRTDLPLLPQLADVLRAAASQCGPVELVGIGVSGLTADAADARSLLMEAKRLGAKSLTLAHDSVTAYLGALGDKRGVVVAAGTGVVSLAVGSAKVARVDGWGNIMGDVGSGYWIGRAVLEAVMRAHDGRGPATALTGLVRAEFPILEDAYIDLQGDEGRVQRIARYAEPATQLASTDAVARGIVRAAAEELAHSAITGLQRVGEDRADSPMVQAIGGVFRSPLITELFEREVKHRLGTAEVQVRTADPLDGAARLPSVDSLSPLRPRLDRAEDL